MMFKEENTWENQWVVPSYEAGGNVNSEVCNLNVVKLYRNVKIEGAEDKTYKEETCALWRIIDAENKNSTDAELIILTGENVGEKYTGVKLQKSQTMKFVNCSKMVFNGYESEWINPAEINMARAKTVEDFGLAVPKRVYVTELQREVARRNDIERNKVLGRDIVAEENSVDFDKLLVDQWNITPKNKKNITPKNNVVDGFNYDDKNNGSSDDEFLNS